MEGGFFPDYRFRYPSEFLRLLPRFGIKLQIHSEWIQDLPEVCADSILKGVKLEVVPYPAEVYGTKTFYECEQQTIQRLSYIPIVSGVVSAAILQPELFNAAACYVIPGEMYLKPNTVSDQDGYYLTLRDYGTTSFLGRRRWVIGTVSVRRVIPRGTDPWVSLRITEVLP